jgi:myosin heavy subunit
MSSFEPGDAVWIPDTEHCFLPAIVNATSNKGGETIQVKLVEGAAVRDLDAKSTKACMTMDMQSLKGVADLVLLNDLNEASLLHNVRERFGQDQIYTNVGDILVAVNPFKRLPIYTPEILTNIAKATDLERTELEPHVYVVAAAAFSAMLKERKNQAVCIAGESGAGKTETMKLVLQFLASSKDGASTAVPSKRVSVLPKGEAPKRKKQEKESIEQQILQTNPVTEAFGNAKTTRNNNSSRFGKWTALTFSSTGSIQGAFIEDYLLEKSRVSFQAPKERNYHSLYFLLQADSEKHGNLAGLNLSENTDDYHYLNQSGVATIPGLDDGEEFDFLVEAFDILKVDHALQEGVWRLLATVLHLGNIECDEVVGDDEHKTQELKFKNDEPLRHVSDLLQFERGALESGLTSKQLGGGGRSIVKVWYTKQQAVSARDALAKSLYGSLFVWLINRINHSLANNLNVPTEAAAQSTKGKKKKKRVTMANVMGASKGQVIGVLDIFGFEFFEHNSFEQLCINYCNEKLQHHFNVHIFTLERQYYESEGVTLPGVSNFVNNDDTLELLESKTGIFSMIDEEILVPKGSDAGFLSKMFNKHAKHAHLRKVGRKDNAINPDTSFVIKHYAADVCYDCLNFLDKNQDKNVLDIDHIKDDFLQRVVKENLEVEQAKAASAAVVVEPTKNRRKKPNKRTTIGTRFKGQLKSLVATLEGCSPLFIRCMKPNHMKVQDSFESPMMLNQLKCAGLMEVCRVRKMGLSSRMLFIDFLSHFEVLTGTHLHPGSVGNKDLGIEVLKQQCEQFCATLVAKGILSKTTHAVGNTKVFMRDVTAEALQAKRREALFEYAAKIQRRARGCVCRAFKMRADMEIGVLMQALGGCNRENIAKQLKRIESGAGMPIPWTWALRGHPSVAKGKAASKVLAQYGSTLATLKGGGGTGHADEVKMAAAAEKMLDAFRAAGLEEAFVDGISKSVERMKRRRDFLRGFQQVLKTSDRRKISAAIEEAQVSELLEQNDLDRAQQRYEEMANDALQVACKTRRISKLGAALLLGRQDGAGEDAIQEARALMLELQTTNLHEVVETRDEAQIATALELATEAGVDEEHLDHAAGVLRRIRDQLQCLKTIEDAVQAHDLKLLQQQLEWAAEIELKETNPTLVQGRIAAKNLAIKAELEQQALNGAQQNYFKEVIGATRRLEAELNIGANSNLDVEPLKALIAHSVELELTGDEDALVTGREVLSRVASEQKEKRRALAQARRDLGKQLETASRRKQGKLLKQLIVTATGMLEGVDATGIIGVNSGAKTLKDKLDSAVRVQKAIEARELREESIHELKAAREANKMETLFWALRKAEAAVLESEEVDQAFEAEVKACRAQYENLVAESEVAAASSLRRLSCLGRRNWTSSMVNSIEHNKGPFERKPPVNLLQILNVDAALWNVFTYYSILDNVSEPEVMQKRAFLHMLRDCHLVSSKRAPKKVMEAEVYAIHTFQSNKTPDHKFTFTVFRTALRDIAAKCFPDLPLDSAAVEREATMAAPSPTAEFLESRNTTTLLTGTINVAAVPKLISEYLLPYASTRTPVSIEDHLNNADIIEMFTLFMPSLKRIFRFFASEPSKFETDVLNRHRVRPDVPKQQQSMTLDAFFVFANNFNITSGRNASTSAVSNLELAAIFFDSHSVMAVDRVGGLNFEEFWEGLVRCALTYYIQLSSSHNEKVEKEQEARHIKRTASFEKGAALLKKPSMRHMKSSDGRQLAHGARNNQRASTKEIREQRASTKGIREKNAGGGNKKHLSMKAAGSAVIASNILARKGERAELQATLYDPFAQGTKVLTCVDTMVNLFELLTESIETSITRSLKTAGKKKTGKNDANLLRLGGNEFVRRLQQQKEARQKQVLGRSRGMTAVTVDLSAVQILTDKELWYVFLHYAVKSGDPWSMDKGRLLAFFKDSRLLQAKTKWQPSMKKNKSGGSKSKGVQPFVRRVLTKQEIGELHRNNAASSKSRQFQFSSFKNVLREAAKMVTEVRDGAFVFVVVAL